MTKGGRKKKHVENRQGQNRRRYIDLCLVIEDERNHMGLIESKKNWSKEQPHMAAVSSFFFFFLSSSITVAHT